MDAPSRAVAYNIAKLQSSKIDVALLPVYTLFGMEVWNGIWKKVLVWNEVWNGRLLVWNERKLPVWNMEISFSIPCYALSATQVKQNSLQSKFACFFLNTISCFILSRDVEAKAGSGSGYIFVEAEAL